MCTQREILQNDLLRSAKLGPWQKKAATEDGRSFSLFGSFCYFSLFVRLFYQTNKGAFVFDAGLIVSAGRRFLALFCFFRDTSSARKKR